MSKWQFEQNDKFDNRVRNLIIYNSITFDEFSNTIVYNNTILQFDVGWGHVDNRKFPFRHICANLQSLQFSYGNIWRIDNEQLKCFNFKQETWYRHFPMLYKHNIDNKNSRKATHSQTLFSNNTLSYINQHHIREMIGTYICCHLKFTRLPCAR